MVILEILMSSFSFLNKTVYYDIKGEDTPLLLLNGIMMSSQSWEPFVDTLSSNFKLIRLDFFDQGQTDSFESSYDQDIQVELIKALLDHLNLYKVNIVGISYGGEVLLKFASKYQSYIDRLILFNSVSYTTQTLAKTGRIWNEFAKKRDSLNYYEQTIPVIYSKTFIDTHKEWMEKRKTYLINGPFSNEVFLDRMIRLTNSAENYDIRKHLESIHVPVLIVGAEEDYLTPLVHQRLLHKNLKTSKLVIIPGVGHASMYEVPELFTTLIIGFFNSRLDYKI